MITQEPLDNPKQPATEQPAKPLLQTIFQNLEIITWLVYLVGLLLPFHYSSVGMMAYIISLLGFFFLYLFFPIPILVSKGWRQHLLAHGIGLILVIANFARLFRLESWEGVKSIFLFALALDLLFLLPFAILYLRSTAEEPGKKFYLNAIIRLLLALLIIGPGLF